MVIRNDRKSFAVVNSRHRSCTVQSTVNVDKACVAQQNRWQQFAACALLTMHAHTCRLHKSLMHSRSAMHQSVLMVFDYCGRHRSNVEYAARIVNADTAAAWFLRAWYVSSRRHVRIHVHLSVTDCHLPVKRPEVVRSWCAMCHIWVI